MSPNPWALEKLISFCVSDGDLVKLGQNKKHTNKNAAKVHSFYGGCWW